MRTTLNLDDSLVREAKQYASSRGRTLTSLIEEGLSAAIRRHETAERDRLTLPTSGGDGPAPGVDLGDLEGIKEILSADEDGGYRSEASGAAS